MSNRVSVQVCKFVDYGMGRGIKDEYWGYRIYDDYGVSYDNMYESMESVFDDLNPSTILTFIQENHEDFHESVVFSNGLYLCDEWVDITDQLGDIEDDE
jgi:hypothetical protein